MCIYCHYYPIYGCKVHYCWFYRANEPAGLQTLKQKLQGHYGYYGITGNLSSLQEFLESAKEIWKRWLARRRRAGVMTWPEFLRLERRHRHPKVRVVHSLLGRAANS
jgi:hypothetical protein